MDACIDGITDKIIDHNHNGEKKKENFIFYTNMYFGLRMIFFYCTMRKTAFCAKKSLIIIEFKLIAESLALCVCVFACGGAGEGVCARVHIPGNCFGRTGRPFYVDYARSYARTNSFRVSGRPCTQLPCA